MLLRILTVISRAEARRRFERLLGGLGVRQVVLGRRERLLQRLASGDLDLVLVEESALPERPEVLVEAVRQLPEKPDVLVLAAQEDPARRAALLAAGCLAVIWSGLGDKAIHDVLRALLERRRAEALQRLRIAGHETSYTLADFVSKSSNMRQFLDVARRVTATDSGLLLLGETGVGKERLARAIHAEGARSSGPFLPVNAGALAESLLESELFGHEEGAFTGATRARRGYFELAHGGTIFLDEIGEMSPHLQAKLLRVLEDRQILRVGGERPVAVDVRVMAATNRDLEAEIAARRFRPDLYYRLAVVTLLLPPLRERREDIPDLAASYLEHFRVRLASHVQGISSEALDALTRYEWPGNVRELINSMERAVLLASGNLILPEDLPHRIGGCAAAGTGGEFQEGKLGRHLLQRPLQEARRELLDRFDETYLRNLLTATDGRIGETARVAGITERSLYSLMRRHRLRKEDYRGVPS